MKKIIILILCLIIPICGYSQNTNQNNSKKEDVTVTFNVSKVSRTLGEIVKFIKDEAKQFMDEAVNNIPEKDKEKYKEAAENVKYEIKYVHDAIHAGWAAGWRGEDYKPPYKHK